MPLELGVVVRGRDGAVGQPGGLFGDELQAFSSSGLVGVARFAGARLLRLHFGGESVEVHGESRFLGHEFGEIDGEAKGVVEEEGLVAADLGPFLVGHFGAEVVEEFDAAVEHGGEGPFLLVDDFDDGVFIFDQFGVGFAEGVDDSRHQFGEKSRLALQNLLSVPRRPPQNPSQYVPPSLVAGYGPVRDGETERPGVIRHRPIRRVPQGDVLLPHQTSVLS
mmetsp:Transcript_38091/g.88641  ORF Transcript_38091/g.88641 Transcript_38091/m.88641 type:complete len:221 (-) Transcript_38091:1267-1929(-)